MTQADTNLPFRYCPGCGEQVYTYTVPKDGAVEVRCSSCGFPLSAEPGHPLGAIDCILIADDDNFFRSLLADLLTERGLTTSAIPCESGATFLTLATERFVQGLPNKVVILDIIMEPLDGIATALALRAVEKGLKVARPTPILFLSAARYNDNLRGLIGRCQPAIYLNKGSDSTPDRLGPRLEKVIAYLLQQGRK